MLSFIWQLKDSSRILFQPNPWLGLIFFREFKNYAFCLLVLEFLFFFILLEKITLWKFHACIQWTMIILTPPPPQVLLQLLPGLPNTSLCQFHALYLVLLFKMNHCVQLVQSCIHECGANHGVLATSPKRNESSTINWSNSSVRGGALGAPPP